MKKGSADPRMPAEERGEKKKDRETGPGEGKNFIAKAIKKPGQLHRDLGVPQGQKIPAGKMAAAAQKGGKVGQRARFAETLKGMKK
jgi:hypothetical protein